MAVPLRCALLWRTLGVFDRRPVLQQPADRVRAASDRRASLTRLPIARIVTGGTHRGATVEPASLRTADDADLPVRIYRPRAATGVLAAVVNFHGGGWVSGNAQQSQWWCSGVAADAGVAVVSVDYRLAPEHPYPAAPEDCYATLCWVAAQAQRLRVDATRLAVMGDSAGGNLAAVVAMMARDRGGPALSLQVLLYPSVRLEGGDFASEWENASAPVLTKADLDNTPGLYVPDAARRGEPYASPLLGTHERLPRALIQTAEHDPLRDQGPAYAAALRAAGVSVRLTNYVDAVHGYISMPGVVPAARQALAEAVAEIRDAVS
ncbi:MAG: alpha/beta hydrolase [Jatrophihabitans sp.]|nr:MAG: alpha/beta hydrolase [Jatrophihabitans sp.]